MGCMLTIFFVKDCCTELAATKLFAAAAAAAVTAASSAPAVATAPDFFVVLVEPDVEVELEPDVEPEPDPPEDDPPELVPPDELPPEELPPELEPPVVDPPVVVLPVVVLPAPLVVVPDPVPVPDADPDALTTPAIAMPFASRLAELDPPPAVMTAPLTEIVCAVRLTWFAVVVLPEARLTEAALTTTLAPDPKEITPLFVTDPVAFKVKVVPLALEFDPDTAAKSIVVPAAIVKSPDTAIVTLAVAKALVTALAIELSIVNDSGSSNHCPVFPKRALTLTEAVCAMFKIPIALVSTLPPLPPNWPPCALITPATFVWRSDQILISPPWPLWIDDASTNEPNSSVVRSAKFSAVILLRVPSAFSV